MLSPRYLAGIGDELADIYAQLEADILQDMARRIARLGKITESTKWQARMLAETGALRKRVRSLIKKYDPAIQKEILAVYNDAMVKNARADNKIFKDAIGHGVSDSNAQAMLAGIEKTYSDLSRLTLTTAFTTEQQFVQQANAAYMQVVSGAFDYDTAMKNACNKLASDGVSSVQYRNGKPMHFSIEAAVRMNILTGVNQTAAQVTLDNCEKLGCDLVETSAHIGARPEHQEWQGKVFSLSGNNKKYPPFSVCGLGTVTGICGVNCRHSYYPYYEGMDRHYSAEDLDELAGQTVEYNGVKMTRYEGEEKLRYIERNIRQYKRRALTEQAGGVDDTASRRKIGEWQAAARDFTKKTGIARDSAREFVGTIDGQQPRGIKPTETPKIITKTPTPQKAPAQVVRTANATPTASVKMQTDSLPGIFNTKQSIKSTAELVRYVNEKAGVNNTVVDLYNNMSKSEVLQKTALNIRYSETSHKLKYNSREQILYINKLVANDPNIIGKAGTNLHEIGHLIDLLGTNNNLGQGSMQFIDAIKKARKYNKNGADLPEEIFNLFKEKILKSAEIHNSINTAANAKITALNDTYEKGGMKWTQYIKEYKAIKRAAEIESGHLIRNAMNGVDALMDIYDALSEGYYQRNGVVSFGHGVKYFYGDTAAQASEIWANYCRLSLTNPDLITLLKKYEPDLISAIDKTAETLLNNLRGTE